MRQTKKSILNQRFLFITKKIQFRIRKAFLRWHTQAKILSASILSRFDVSYSQYKHQFGIAKLLNKALREKKQALNLRSPMESLRTAFVLWKMNTSYNLSSIYQASTRTKQMHIVANILKKNLVFILRDAFWVVKDFTNRKTSHSPMKKRMNYLSAGGATSLSQMNP